MIIPKSDVPVFFNNKSFVSEQNIPLLWRADSIPTQQQRRQKKSANCDRENDCGA